MAAPTFQAIMASRIREKEYVDVKKILGWISRLEWSGFFR